jgi:hypothetical protein
VNLSAAPVRIAVEYNPARRGEALTCRLLHFFSSWKETGGYEQAQEGGDRQASGKEEADQGARPQRAVGFFDAFGGVAQW